MKLLQNHLTQGKFILILEVFIAIVIVLYFGVLLKFDFVRVVIILLFSLVGIGGSYGVAWFGIRVIPSPTRAPPSPALVVSPIPSTTRRSKPA
jgi:hypothetical protein